ncbi:DUF6907 domain-containing protein [Nocardia sp. NBC_00403]|uniref:DUF6907 domain-containing protein n=1 Tax=Nocardia sp. NBC_00403 TaxID=2975990 RepID=UPI002E248414
MTTIQNATDWTDLNCSSCGAFICRIAVPLGGPAQCQPCQNRAPGCASWCAEGEHSDALFLDDAVCWGPEVVIPLSLEPSPGLALIPSLEISPRRQIARGVDSVYVCWQHLFGTDIDLSVSEARQLAAVLLTIADRVDVD